jgi:hypothetical protein
MIIGDIESQSVVTPRTIQETKKDGTVVTKKVWEPLHTPTERSTSEEFYTVENQNEYPEYEYEPADIPTQPDATNKNVVCTTLVLDLVY